MSESRPAELGVKITDKTPPTYPPSTESQGLKLRVADLWGGRTKGGHMRFDGENDITLTPTRDDPDFNSTFFFKTKYKELCKKNT